MDNVQRGWNKADPGTFICLLDDNALSLLSMSEAIYFRIARAAKTRERISFAYLNYVCNSRMVYKAHAMRTAAYFRRKREITVTVEKKCVAEASRVSAWKIILQRNN